MNFDRDAAVGLGEAAEREREAQTAKAEMEGLEELPKLEDRPRVPEPLPTPESQGVFVRMRAKSKRRNRGISERISSRQYRSSW